jgi:hypothetical protein
VPSAINVDDKRNGAAFKAAASGISCATPGSNCRSRPGQNYDHIRNSLKNNDILTGSVLADHTGKGA